MDGRKLLKQSVGLLVVLLMVGCGNAQVEPTTTSMPLATTPTPAPPTATPKPEATATPEATPTITPFPIDLSLDEIAAELEGLSLDEFFETSFRHLLVRDPEFVTTVGLDETLGLRNDRLTDLSEAAAEERYQLQRLILEMLRRYDREGLPSLQHISYDVYEWYLDDLIQGYEFRDHHYLMRHFYSGYHHNLIRLFTELHPMDSREDAEDYIARLSQVPAQVEQVIEGLERRKAAGIVLPRFSLYFTRRDLVNMLQMSNDDPSTIRRATVIVFPLFNDKLSQIEGLSREDRLVLRDACLTQVEESFIPAMLALINKVDELAAVATDDDGIWKLPYGDAFYSYLLRHETSTDLTAAEIHQLGLDEVDRIHSEMRAIYNQLGYAPDAGLEELLQLAVDEAGYVNTSSQAGRDQVVAEYEAILGEINERLYDVLDVRPRMELLVVAEQGRGGYYTGGTLDGSRPGVFHAGVGRTEFSKFEMATVAFHEAIPGHHLQDALVMELELPTFRNVTFYNGYGEGWALYAERLAWELGFFEDDPYGNLGRLYMELLRSVRLVADTGIHALGWTREEAKAYMTEVMGGSLWNSEVDRYIVWPAQSTGYKVGMLKILELRQRAMEALGDHYDPKAFHRVVLLNGNLPLSILEKVVGEYIEVTLAQ